MKRKRYDHHQADQWEDHLLKSGYLEMSNSTRHFLFALRFLERNQGIQVFDPIVSSHSNLAKHVGMSRNTLASVLKDSESLGLIEHEPGQSVIGGAATSIRRCTLQEIETGVLNRHLKRYTPNAAKQVKDALKGRNLSYGGTIYTPTLNIAKTGRIYISNAGQVQQDSSDIRVRKAIEGLEYGEQLIHVDIKQAEPTIVLEELRRRKLEPKGGPADIYQLMASILGISRSKAKGDFLRMIYSPNTIATMREMQIPKGNYIWELGEAIERLKSILWEQGKPRRKVRRHVHTLGRTMIESLKGESPHKGSLLSWKAQGSIADIVNASILQILAKEAVRGWRFLFQVYDEIYVATRHPDDILELEGVLQEQAGQIEVTITTKAAREQPRTE